jgi:hypothetical protein
MFYIQTRRCIMVNKPATDSSGPAFESKLQGPVHTSVISSVELAAVTHVTVPKSFTCVRETGRSYHSTAREVMSTRICGDRVNVSHRNEDRDKCVWGQYTWVLPTANTMPQRARPRKWLTCEPGLRSVILTISFSPTRQTLRQYLQQIKTASFPIFQYS